MVSKTCSVIYEGAQDMSGFMFLSVLYGHGPVSVEGSSYRLISLGWNIHFDLSPVPKDSRTGWGQREQSQKNFLSNATSIVPHQSECTVRPFFQTIEKPHQSGSPGIAVLLISPLPPTMLAVTLGTILRYSRSSTR